MTTRDRPTINRCTIHRASGEAQLQASPAAVPALESLAVPRQIGATVGEVLLQPRTEQHVGEVEVLLGQMTSKGVVFACGTEEEIEDGDVIGDVTGHRDPGPASLITSNAFFQIQWALLAKFVAHARDTAPAVSIHRRHSP
ncbi:MAG: hypothetical protein IPK74_38300 [Deltaproteobacteria bacterium]|nr:hypothetical protein [Deltaproteobacteria bacterium]